VDAKAFFRGLAAATLLLLAAGCAGTAERRAFNDLESLSEEAAWRTLEILWSRFEDLDKGPQRVLAVYPLVEEQPLFAGQLIEELSIHLANAFQEDGVAVRLVSRSALDPVLRELAFQSSDLADPQTQLELGRQLAAEMLLVVTVPGTGSPRRLGFQVLEVESGVLLGGFTLLLN
jgi:hypothetical protein